MTLYSDGIKRYVALYAGRVMGIQGGLADSVEVPPEVANKLVMDLKDWLIKPVLIKDPITVAELAGFFDENIGSDQRRHDP